MNATLEGSDSNLRTDTLCRFWVFCSPFSLGKVFVRIEIPMRMFLERTQRPGG